MNTFKISSRYPQDVTILSNTFLDGYMPQANGEFVKIYLYLLRVSQDPAKSVSLSQIADRMTCTENDVIRAVRYWEKTGLLIVETRMFQQPGAPWHVRKNKSEKRNPTL